MEDRTAAIQSAADRVAPLEANAEQVGANIQNAGRDVLGKQEQAQGFVKDLAERSNQDLAKTKEDAKLQQEAANAKAEADKEAAQAKATHAQGTAMQDTAATELENRRAAGVQGAKDIAKNISGQDELPVAEADRKIIDSLRNANQEAHSEESAAHEALTKAAKERGVTVDPAPMQDVAKGIVNLEGPAKDLVMSSLPAATYRMLEKVAQGGEEGATAHPLDDISNSIAGRPYTEVKALAADQAAKGVTSDARNIHQQNWPAALEKVESTGKSMGVPTEPTVAANPPVPYDVMKTGRTAVGEALQASRKHFQSTGMGSNAGRALTDLYGSMTDAMKKSLAPHADLTAQFEKANALTKDRNTRFVDPQFIRSLVYKGDSQKVIGRGVSDGN
jgi:hypothetical protein